ncbi:MAG: transposase [Oscillospiraceae bacterium]|nr:transposase [Oscillospiraceae bacterium]
MHRSYSEYNKTKVLKRTCYGMRNFNNFRKRILFCNT